MRKSVIILAVVLVTTTNLVNALNSKSFKKDQVEFLSESASALQQAIFKGEIETVKRLIESGANVNKVFRDMSPLMTAARYNKPEIIEFLLKKGANPSIENERGFTALEYAELIKAEECITLLKGWK